MKYYNQGIKEVLNILESDEKKGLHAYAIESRRNKYGFNELQAHKKLNPFMLFLRQFQSFIIYILFFAVIIALIAKEYIDVTVILFILLLNAAIGFWQEWKAERDIAALRKMVGSKAKIIRDGKMKIVDARELVPGDIIQLEEGNKVPADARLISTISLQIAESSLTGESAPVTKVSDTIDGERPLAERKNMVFSGTLVTKGKGTAVVVSTGMHTQIGKIAGMINDTGIELTPLQKRLDNLGKWIGAATIIVCILVFITGIMRNDLHHLLLAGNYVEFLFESKEWLMIAVALAVAAVPEGLPAIVTIALAIGVMKMVKRNVLVRRLPSVETLGETTVICSDKTGTLTRNEMTVRKIFADNKVIDVGGEGYDLEGDFTVGGKPWKSSEHIILKAGALCNDAHFEVADKRTEIIGDPTEAALLVSAYKTGIDYKELRKTNSRITEEPFDSVRKMMSVAYKEGSKNYVYTKGAPEQVLKLCNKIIIDGKVKTLTAENKKEILTQNTKFAKQSLRVLAFAYKEYKNDKSLESDLVFIGLQGMIDPPHKEVKGAIARCSTAGIRVLMITGDNLHTAQSIADEIGIKGNAIEGLEFGKMSREEQKAILKTTSIFARVEPKHKLRIVELLQEEKEVVAMTGDGVNDAPAIKKSDLGIAMGITGTDVAKEASDMILQDDNFTSIVNAVEEGRGIYENIRKFVNYLLSCNVGEVLVIFVGIVLGWDIVMTAVMLLWLNVVTDGLPALALSVDPNPKNLMEKPPVKASEGIMNNSMKFNIIYVSILIAIGVLSLFWWATQQNVSLAYAQTMAFTAIIVMELVRLQAIRSEYKLGIFSNKFLVLAVASSLFLQLLVLYTPLGHFFGTVSLGVVDWLLILTVSAIVYVFNTAGEQLKNHMGWFQH